MERNQLAKAMAGGAFEMNLKILTIEQLKQLEERLYDREVDGEDVWFERDQVLNELIRRQTYDE